LCFALNKAEDSMPTTQTRAPVITVPRYVLAAVQAAIDTETELTAWVARRESATAALHTQLLRWEEAHPGTSRRALSSAIYAALGLERGTDEYLRVAQRISRAWRYDPEHPTPDPMPLPRAVAGLVERLKTGLAREGWEVAKVEQRPQAIVVKLRPLGEAPA
jgi:hypothetical protein